MLSIMTTLCCYIGYNLQAFNGFVMTANKLRSIFSMIFFTTKLSMPMPCMGLFILLIFEKVQLLSHTPSFLAELWHLHLPFTPH